VKYEFLRRDAYLLAAGIVSLVNERQWGRVFQATQVMQRLDQLPAPRHA
jgi:hypothetical protein